MLDNIKIGDVVFFVNIDKVEKHTVVDIKETTLGQEKATLYILDGTKRIVYNGTEYNVDINSTSRFLFPSEKCAEDFIESDKKELQEIKLTNEKLNIKIE